MGDTKLGKWAILGARLPVHPYQGFMEESDCKKGKWGILGKKAENRSHQEYEGVL